MLTEFPGGLEATISALIAVIIELFPPLRQWWDRFTSRQKQAMILIIVLAVSIAGAYFTCKRGGPCPEDWVDRIISFVWAFVASLIATQGAQRGVKYLPANQE